MLNEQDLLDLYELRKSMVPQYEIRDHLPGFEKVELMALWRTYGTEKMRWALRELGLHTGWKFRMLAKILDGSANINYVPEFIADKDKPKVQPAPPSHIAYHKLVGDDDIASNEALREAVKKIQW